MINHLLASRRFHHSQPSTAPQDIRPCPAPEKGAVETFRDFLRTDKDGKSHPISSSPITAQVGDRLGKTIAAVRCIAYAQCRLEQWQIKRLRDPELNGGNLDPAHVLRPIDVSASEKKRKREYELKADDWNRLHPDTFIELPEAVRPKRRKPAEPKAPPPPKPPYQPESRLNLQSRNTFRDLLMKNEDGTKGRFGSSPISKKVAERLGLTTTALKNMAYGYTALDENDIAALRNPELGENLDPDGVLTPFNVRADMRRNHNESRQNAAAHKSSYADNPASPRNALHAGIVAFYDGDRATAASSTGIKRQRLNDILGPVGAYASSTGVSEKTATAWNAKHPDNPIGHHKRGELSERRKQAELPASPSESPSALTPDASSSPVTSEIPIPDEPGFDFRYPDSQPFQPDSSPLCVPGSWDPFQTPLSPEMPGLEDIQPSLLPPSPFHPSDFTTPGVMYMETLPEEYLQAGLLPDTFQ